jgi:hypothetical protein
MFAGIAFISFKTEEMKDLVLEQNTFTPFERMKAYYNKGKKQNPEPDELILEGNKLYCEQAPEPNDVDWEFVHIPTNHKIKARVKAWSISITFMLSCFFLVWFLTEIGDKLTEKAEEEEAEGIRNSPTMILATAIS